MAKPVLLNTGPMMSLIEEGVEKAFAVHRLHQAADREALLSRIAPDVRAICTGSHTGVRTDAAMLARFPNLKIIGNFGVGYDTIDIPAAAGRGIVITNTPDVLTEEVADTSVALLLATVRELYDAERWLRDGRWPKEGEYRLTASLRDRKVGIAGFGRIGKAVARRARGFTMRVLYWGPRRKPEAEENEAGITYVPLEQLLAESDFVSLHSPLRPETRHQIGARELRLMKKTAYLINTARGPIVDEAALIRALTAGKIAGAGLDVFEFEPKVERALLKLPNVVLTPHLGSAVLELREEMAHVVVDNIMAILEGRMPPNCINPQVLADRATS